MDQSVLALAVVLLVVVPLGLEAEDLAVLVVKFLDRTYHLEIH